MLFQPKYDNRKALIIGIDKYKYVSPLNYAGNDSDGVAEILKTRFDFYEDDIVLLKDEKATKNNIIRALHSFGGNNMGVDDKLLVFFAGHGHTVPANRGEIGFLVPVDGKANETCTLIAWREFTHISELIRAKHILYIMDACYGGLALTRGPAQGTARFLKNMCQRFARQVLSAGKADEPVADGEGPLPGHSIFTGHFLQGLEGGAASDNGIITANNIMAYVYEKVGSDPHSHQTPHYGFIDGDGDFIFTEDALNQQQTNEEENVDVLVSIPLMLPDQSSGTFADQIKYCIAEPSKRIFLHDLTVNRIKEFHTKTEKSKLSINGVVINPATVQERLTKYEDASEDLVTLIVLLSYWGDAKQHVLIEKILKLITSNNGSESGTTVWLNMRWYPSCLLLYAGGIAALANENYAILAKLFSVNVDCKVDPDSRNIVTCVSESMARLHDTFKLLPNLERKYVPRSEYLFTLLQPVLDRQLYLGESYETLFDRLEMFLALMFADVNDSEWAPFGRFAYKHGYAHGRDSIYIQLMEEANALKNDWAPFRAGLFGKSIERFNKVAERYLERINKFAWF